MLVRLPDGVEASVLLAHAEANHKVADPTRNHHPTMGHRPYPEPSPNHKVTGPTLNHHPTTRTSPNQPQADAGSYCSPDSLYPNPNPTTKGHVSGRLAVLPGPHERW